MKLYRVASSREASAGYIWFGTQDEAKKASKDLGGPWDAIEVPVDKKGLLNWLNENDRATPPMSDLDPLEQAEARAVAAAGSGTVVPSTYQSPLDARTTLAMIDAGMCSQAINQMDGQNLAKVVKASIIRMAELGRAIPVERTDNG